MSITGASIPAQVKARLKLAEAILRDSEVFVVAIGDKAPYVDPSGRYEQIFVVGRHDFGAAATQQLVTHLRDDVLSSVHFPAGTSLYLGGAPAQGVDFLNSVYATFPWLVLLALALAWLVLARAFRSVLLALLAVLLDLVSVGVAYGVLVAYFASACSPRCWAPTRWARSRVGYLSSSSRCFSGSRWTTRSSS